MNDLGKGGKKDFPATCANVRPAPESPRKLSLILGRNHAITTLFLRKLEAAWRQSPWVGWPGVHGSG